MSTYRKEWPCCGSATETEAFEPDFCPICRSRELEDAIRKHECLKDEPDSIDRNLWTVLN